MWRIYYADGSTFDWEQGLPAEAPGRGVICIVQPDPDTGRHRVSGFGYYWWRDHGWFGGDLFGLFDYLQDPGQKVVKFGRTVSNERFREICRRADNDADFPPRSGYRRGERV